MALDETTRAMLRDALKAPAQGMPVDIRIDGTIGAKIVEMGETIADAIKAIETPEIPQFPKPVDNAAQLQSIAKAIASIEGASDVATAAREVASAVARLRFDATDMSPVVSAIEENTVALRDVLKELRKPRKIKTDEMGIPTGIE